MMNGYFILHEEQNKIFNMKMARKKGLNNKSIHKHLALILLCLIISYSWEFENLILYLFILDYPVFCSYSPVRTHLVNNVSPQ